MWHRAAMSLAAAAMVVGVAKTNSVREGELVVPRALRGTDVDGTIGNAKDRDEEWVIEMAIPLASLGIAGRSGEHLELSVRRCDELREGGRACGAWGTEAAPIALVLGK